MPLHAITYDYGEEGLRAQLPPRLPGSPAPPACSRPHRRWNSPGGCTPPHRLQREPYVNHLLRVALRINCHYGVDDPDIITAALLHDAVEDHAWRPVPRRARRRGRRPAQQVRLTGRRSWTSPTPSTRPAPTATGSTGSTSSRA